MQHADFSNVDAVSIHRISDSCSDVVVGCTDVAGIVMAVKDVSSKLRTEHGALEKTVAALETDQQKVSEASDEARLLSERAIERLSQGTHLIESSLGEISGLLELVETLTQHVTGFAAAMEQVRRCSQDIDHIAETTNILALNATIEAMRAGEAGRTFAVVANEVKSLAGDTRRATEEISRTIDTLGAEAERVIAQIETGAHASKNAKASVTQIEETIGGVAQLVEEVDRQNDQIARATSTISDHVHKVKDVVVSFKSAASENESKLDLAHTRMEQLELTASDMFDAVVKAGLSPVDDGFVEIAQLCAKEVNEKMNNALISGEISESDAFDRDYKLIEGSTPERFTTRIIEWAALRWTPILDAVEADTPEIISAVCMDENGHLVAHLSKMSQPQTGNIAHDTLFCRAGRIFGDYYNIRAGKSNADYIMSVYRRDSADGRYDICRSVHAPIHLNGRRWGSVQITYIV